jgi:diguanylate cyclase (GGDEF)-like protein
VGLAGLSVVSLLLMAAAYLGSGEDRLTLANGAWISCALVSVVGVGVATHRSSGRQRRAWALLLAACAAWLFGELAWTVYSATSFPGAPSLADAFWLSFALAGVAVHRLGTASGRSWRIVWLELIPLLVAVAALITAAMWDDISSSKLSAAAEITTLAYPVFYVMVALVMLQAVMAGALNVRDRGMAVLLAGLALEALAFVLWCPQLLDGTYTAGTTAIDSLWVVGMLLIGIGAWFAKPGVARHDDDRTTERRGGLLPVLTFVALAATQVVLVATGADIAAELVLSGATLLVGVMLSLRSAVLRREHGDLLAQLRDREAELELANARLSDESRLDALTGLANRLRLREDFETLRHAAERGGSGYSIVLCDLDRFKAYNDSHGHQAGDRILRHISALLDGQTREGDRVYRYGGEELLIVLRQENAATATAVAERHRAAVQAAGFAHLDNEPAGVVTLSAGVATAEPEETPEQVLARADDALYAAKRHGRNRVETASPSPTAPRTLRR